MLNGIVHKHRLSFSFFMDVLHMCQPPVLHYLQPCNILSNEKLSGSVRLVNWILSQLS